MADDFKTEAVIDVSVNGGKDLSNAADNAAKLENTLRNVAQAAGELAKQLDKAQSSAFNSSNANTAKTAAAAAQALSAQAKAQSTLNAAAAKAVQNRGAGGQFASGTNKTSLVKDQLTANSGTGLNQLGVNEYKRLQDNITEYDRKANRQRLDENLSYLNTRKTQTLKAIQDERAATAAAFGGKVAPGQNGSGAAGDLGRAEGHLQSTAYSLLNLSLILGGVSAAFGAADVAALKTAIDFQRAFADVQRTTGVTGAAADALKGSLIELSQSIPVSFQNITEIATAAGQLNISAGQVDNFAKVVAEFSATTDVSTELAATALGRLGQLLPDVAGNYEGLGSAILKVGVNSVATESQIVAIATNIAGISRAVGLTTPEVIGLSGALASIGVQPELARGTVTRLFTNIQVAVDTSSDKLASFAKVSGVSAEQFSSDWKSAPSDAIQELLGGINKQGDAAIQTLLDLGIASARDIPAVLRLAQNGDILARALDDASSGFSDATELGAQFGIIAETVAAKLQVTQNDFQALMDAIGSSATGPVAAFLDGINAVLVALTQIINNPVGQWVAAAMLIIGGLVAVLAAVAAGGMATVGSLLLLQAALDSTAISAGVASAAMSAFKVALIGTGIGAALVLIGTLVAGLMQAAGAFDQVGDKGKAAFGSLDSLQNALAQDQAVYEQTGKAIGQISLAFDASADSADRGTIAYGKNAQAALKSALISSQAFKDLATNSGANTLLKLGGGSTKGFLEAALGDPVNGAKEYVDKAKAALRAELAAGGSDPIAAGGVIAAGFNEQFDGLYDSAAQIKDALQGAALGASLFADDANNAAVAAGNLSAETTDADGNVTTLGDALKQTIDDLYGATNAAAATQQSLYDLGAAFINNGAQAASSGSEIQQVIANIVAQSATTGDAANNLQGFFNALIAGGYATASQLVILQQVIASLGGATNAAKVDMSSFTNGQKKAQVAVAKTGGSARKAAKEIKTLSDYASDLKGVIDKAFEFRFGAQKSLDEINSKFQDMQQEVIDTNNDVRDLQNSLAKDLSDVGILKYFKQVADAYGDTLRSADLASQIGDLNAEIADKSADLAAAQAKQTKTTVGNSAAAIKNRADLLDLVGGYKDYVSELANSGLNQDQLKAKVNELRQQFIAQATQLGYNANEVEGYAQEFTDLTNIINRLPRNITISANTDPATRALNEFLAKAASSKADVPVGSSGAGASGAAAGSAFGNAFTTSVARAVRAAQPIQGYLFNGQQVYSVPGTSIKYFAQGGEVGGEIHGPGTGTSDSILAGVSNGEFVVRAQAAQPNLGILNYLNKNGRLPGFADGGSVGSAGSSPFNGAVMAALSPDDRALLRGIADRIGNIEVEFVDVSRAAARGDSILKSRGGR